MILQSLSLFGVGRHNGLLLQDLDAGLTVVYGPNESGKSTLLAGIRGILFGRVMMAERPIQLDKHAMGLLTAMSEGGELIHVERALHRRSAPKVTTAQATVLSGQEVLKEYFPELAEVEDVVYTSVFSFQLAEMNDLRQSDAALVRRIFSLGATGGVSPLDLETALEQAAKTVFHPDKRARNALLNQRLKESDQVRQVWQMKQDRLPEYQRLQAQAAELRESISVCENRLHEIRHEKQRLQKRMDALPFHQALVRTSAMMAEDTQAALSEDSISAIAVIRERTADSVAQKERLVARLSDVDGEIDAWPEVQVHSDKAIRVRELVMQSSGVMQQAEALAERRREWDDYARQRAELRQQISSGWSEQALQQADIGADVAHTAEEFAKRLEQLQRSMDALVQQEASALRTLKDLSLQYDVACDARGGERIPLSTLRAAMERAEQSLQRVTEDELVWVEADRDLQQLRQSELTMGVGASRGTIERPRMRQAQNAFTITAIVVGVLSALAGWSADRPWWTDAVLFVVSSAIVFGLWQFIRKGLLRSQMQMSEGERQARQRSLEALMANHVQRLSAPTAKALSGIPYEDVRSQLRELRRRSEAEKAVLSELTALAQRIEDAQRAHSRIKGELADAAERQTHIQQSWYEWLSQYGMKASRPAPASFRLDLDLVRQYRSMTGRMEALGHSMEGLSNSILSFCRMAEQVMTGGETTEGEEEIAAAREGDEAFYDPASVSILCERLKQEAARLAEAEQVAQSRRRLCEQRDRLLDELTHVEAELTARLAEKASRYAELGISTDDDYEALLKSNQERTDREGSIREYRFQLYGLFGGKAAYEDEITSLNAATADSLKQELQDIDVVEETVKEQIASVSRSLHELEHRLTMWDDGASALDLVWQIHSLEDEKRTLAREFAVNVLALNIAQQARVRFEREHRPGVLEAASRWFSQMTEGRYEALNARNGEKGTTVITAVDAGGREWPVSMLSRGTQEQIYFALRLAVIDEYANAGVRLPVILDDPLVNFDQRRLSEALTVLQAFAKDKQVLYLTCHPHVLSFAESNSETTVRRLTRP